MDFNERATHGPGFEVRQAMRRAAPCRGGWDAWFMNDGGTYFDPARSARARRAGRALPCRGLFDRHHRRLSVEARSVRLRGAGRSCCTSVTKEAKQRAGCGPTPGMRRDDERVERRPVRLHA